MRTISISRLIGSNAGEIARRLAEELRYDLVDKQILDRVFRLYGLTRLGNLYTSPPNFWALANARNLLMVSMLNDTMEALAHRGRTVILGRGGFASLNEYVDVLNVRLQAPFPIRVERVMARENISERSRAEKLVKKDDKARQRFVAAFYHKSWDTASDFGLVIDTSLISIATATDIIIQASRGIEQRKTFAKGLEARRAEVEPALLDAIDQALAHRAELSIAASPEVDVQSTRRSG
jgi:cytidylate kinase